MKVWVVCVVTVEGRVITPAVGVYTNELDARQAEAANREDSAGSFVKEMEVR